MDWPESPQAAQVGLTSMRMSEQAIHFVAIGAIGFIVDGGILTLLHSVFDLSLLHARLFSFSIAVTITWYLNRQNTFSNSRDVRAINEWSRYAAVNTVSAVLNIGIFLWVIFHFEALANRPIVPLANAASIVLVFNFLMSRSIAFRHNKS